MIHDMYDDIYHNICDTYDDLLTMITNFAQCPGMNSIEGLQICVTA
jgi:hypothetical protein